MTRTPAEIAATLAGQFAEAVVEQEMQVLHLVQAEVEGLTKAAAVAMTPVSAPSTDAETEAGFDNMPV